VRDLTVAELIAEVQTLRGALVAERDAHSALKALRHCDHVARLDAAEALARSWADNPAATTTQGWVAGELLTAIIRR
jgi:hypothetical protein